MDRCASCQHLVDAPAIIGRDACRIAGGLGEAVGPAGERGELQSVDRSVQVADQQGGGGATEGRNCRLRLEQPLAGADVAEVRRASRPAAQLDHQEAAWLADGRRRINIADAGRWMVSAVWLHDGMHGRARQRHGVR